MDGKPDFGIGSSSYNLANPILVLNFQSVLNNEVAGLDKNIFDFFNNSLRILILFFFFWFFIGFQSVLNKLFRIRLVVAVLVFNFDKKMA